MNIYRVEFECDDEEIHDPIFVMALDMPDAHERSLEIAAIDWGGNESRVVSEMGLIAQSVRSSPGQIFYALHFNGDLEYGEPAKRQLPHVAINDYDRVNPNVIIDALRLVLSDTEMVLDEVADWLKSLAGGNDDRIETDYSIESGLSNWPNWIKYVDHDAAQVYKIKTNAAIHFGVIIQMYRKGEYEEKVLVDETERYRIFLDELDFEDKFKQASEKAAQLLQPESIIPATS